MIKLESNTLKNYYGEKPNDYDVKFVHYSLDVEDGEYEEIYNDLKNIKEEVRNSFLIYFSHVKDFNKILYNSKIIMDKFKKDMYLRIRNQDEYNKYKKANTKVLLVIGINDLKDLEIDNDDIILQINSIKELSIKDLEHLLEKYSIKKISLGQIAYITNEYPELLETLSKMYRVKNNDQLELEKNNKLTNDLYTIDEYKQIFNSINEIIDKSTGKDNIEKFINIFNELAKEINYAEDDKETKIINHNLIGPIVNKKCVCEGYSKLLHQICSMLNIESIVVSGGGSKENGGHIWNKVKIDDKWYNADLTSQSYAIHNNENKDYCLVEDNYMKYKSTSPFDVVCDEPYKKRQAIEKKVENDSKYIKILFIFLAVILAMIVIKKIVLINSVEETIENETIEEKPQIENKTEPEEEKPVNVDNYPFSSGYYNFTYERQEHIINLDTDSQLILHSGVLIDNTKVYINGNVRLNDESNASINTTISMYDENHNEIGTCEQTTELSSEIVSFSCQKSEEELKNGKQFEDVKYYKIEIASFDKNEQ